jgi:hypothetical protein
MGDQGFQGQPPPPLDISAVISRFRGARELRVTPPVISHSVQGKRIFQPRFIVTARNDEISRIIRERKNWRSQPTHLSLHRSAPLTSPLRSPRRLSPALSVCGTVNVAFLRCIPQHPATMAGAYAWTIWVW